MTVAQGVGVYSIGLNVGYMHGRHKGYEEGQ